MRKWSGDDVRMDVFVTCIMDPFVFLASTFPLEDFGSKVPWS